MKLGIREAIFVLLMLGLLGCSYWFGFRRLDDRRHSMEDEIKSRTSALNDLRSSTAGIDNLEKKIVDLQQAIRFFESKLPKEKEVEDVLQQVTQLAQQNNLVSRTFRTLKTERGGNYSEQQLQMSLSGDFEGFYAFLLKLEKLPRITRITRMNLQKINDDEGKMQAEVVLSIYFEPDASRDADSIATVR
jgi:Tfp pilus assembly protein PilO